ncbi:hypothetical protein [Psychroflexus sp. MES1-P1E]
MQPDDMEKTWADTNELKRDYNYKPSTSVSQGVDSFVEWYKNYY